MEVVAVSGGTGFLGAAVVRELRNAGRDVIVLSRHLPSGHLRVRGVRYKNVDLSEPLDPELLEGTHAVVHCAAATSGGWEEHKRNTIASTHNLLNAAAAGGVRRFVHVSSMAVLESNHAGSPISETAPLLRDSRSRGPYAWGKLESERLALKFGAARGLDIRVVRPGALLDAGNITPPGRLGRRIGAHFIAVGSPKHKIAVCEIGLAATVLTHIALREDAPRVLNLLDPDLPTKQELVDALRRNDPTVSVVWVPPSILWAFSTVFEGYRSLFRPNRLVANPARVFTPEDYDTSAIRILVQRLSLLG